DGDVVDVSPIRARHAGARRARPGESTVCPRTADAPSGGVHSRSGARGEWATQPADWRAQRLAVSTAGTVERIGIARRWQELDRARIQAERRRRSLSPHDVHVLETHQPAA